MTALLLRPKEGNLKFHQISEDYSELDCKVGSFLKNYYLTPSKNFIPASRTIMT